jgi:predicted esterase
MCQQERKQRKRLTKTIVSEVRSEVLLTKSRQFSRTFFDGLSNGTIFFHYVTKRHEVASGMCNVCAIGITRSLLFAMSV